MDLKKALKILNLTQNYTEEQLKKNYRRLANVYHPDRNNTEEANQLMKEINEARDYLVLYLKERNSNPQNDSYFDLESYKKEKIRIINDKVEFTFEKNTLSTKIKAVIDTIITYEKKFIASTNSLNSKSSIDNTFNQYINNIKFGFNKLKEVFYQEYFIKEGDVKDSIEFDCTLNDFFTQLLKIKDKYSLIEKATKLLNEQIKIYEEYAGYDKIKFLIESIKKNTFNKIKRNSFNYSMEDIKEMHTEILEIFNLYHSLNTRIIALNNDIANVDDIEITKKFYKTAEEAQTKIDVFYATNRLADEEYTELSVLIEEVYGK